MIQQELTYWVTLAMIPRIWTKRKNELYVKCYKHQPQVSIIQLFEDERLWQELGMSQEEMSAFVSAKTQLPNNSFLVEQLLEQGYHIITLDSADYPQTLKDNLKMGAPSVLFAKGNIQMLKKTSVAVVGSRNASEVSLNFTANVAHEQVAKGKVIVSGYAKGVDRKALEAALEINGESIIVLPQGITTFASGFKAYYKYIMQGKLLVVSTFHPNAPWSVELAMARNQIIYGLADSIFVAQSDDKGGTWSGVMDGLRKGRQIFVRLPHENENNANKIIIQKGATPVDMNGVPIVLTAESLMTDEEKRQKELSESVQRLLLAGLFTSQEIRDKLNLDWTDAKMKKYLRCIPDVRETRIKNKLYFNISYAGQQELFAWNT